jgi:muramoyltetrapeptide carboxypeptidase
MPRALRAGDRVRIVAPAGPVSQEAEARLVTGADILRSWGLDVATPSLVGRVGALPYLAGDDDVRRVELREAWGSVSAVVAARGGYGSARILSDWKWPDCEEPPWVVGFSDVTALHWSLASIGVGSGHGPAVIGLSEQPEWSQQRLRAMLFGQALDALYGEGVGSGRATGRLLAANMAVATSLFGTRWMPDLDGVVLVLEDVNEPPYRIDRLFTQWSQAGIFDRVAGVALGRFTHADEEAMDAVLRERVAGLGVPVILNLPVGHDGPNAALPVGAPATVDAAAGTLSLV